MLDINNSAIQTGTSKSDFTINDLAPNNYLTIMWNGYKGEKFKVQTLSVDLDMYNEMIDLSYKSVLRNRRRLECVPLVKKKYYNYL